MAKIPTTTQANIDDQNHVSMWLLWLVIGAVVTFWIAYAFFAWNPESKGLFGDAFGALNTLFSGLAFAAIIYTVYLQRQELGLQRKEMELTRDELKGQKEQLEIQNRLTVQSAQLAAIPLLIEQELHTLGTLEGSYFSGWSTRPHPLQELEAEINRLKEHISALKTEQVERDENIQKKGATGVDHFIVLTYREQGYRCKREICAAEHGLCSIERLISLRQRLQTIYSRVTEAESTS